MKIKSSHDSAIQVPDIYPEELKVEFQRGYHGSILHNNYNEEANQMSTDRGIDKQNVLYTYKGTLLSLKKKIRTHPTIWNYTK